MTFDKDFFRQVMGQFATGVTIVTACNKGALVGLTVNAFCTVSLDPPLVLVCVDLQSNTLPHIRESGAFAVNILTDQQEHFSRCFATSSEERYEHFCRASYSVAATGSPVLADVLAFIDARIVAEYPGGDHVIFVGQVEAMGTNDQVAFADEAIRQEAIQAGLNGNGKAREPLAYYRGHYRHLDSDYSKPSLAVYHEPSNSL